MVVVEVVDEVLVDDDVVGGADGVAVVGGDDGVSLVTGAPSPGEPTDEHAPAPRANARVRTAGRNNGRLATVR